MKAEEITDEVLDNIVERLQQGMYVITDRGLEALRSSEKTQESSA